MADKQQTEKQKANIRKTVLDGLEWGTDEFVEEHASKKTKATLPEGVHGGAVCKDIVHLAWPTFIELTLASLTSMVDMMMVGNLGPSAISSVSLAAQPKFILMTVFMSMCTGSTALVARCRGANDPKPKAGRLYPPDGSKSETDHPPTNRFAISYGKGITLPLHSDASPQAASHNVRSTFHIGEANISRRSHFTFAQQIFHVAQQHI